MAYAFGNFELDVSSMELRERGEVVSVPPKVLEVLLYLVRNRDRVVAQKELLDAVWCGINVSPNSLAQAIASVRRLLHDGNDEIIRTVHSRGYRFVASVEHGLDAPPSTEDRSDLPFVGRAATIERLLLRLEEARAGKGDIVLVTGPAGIGKTRTVEELARAAEKRGGQVRKGRCYEDGEVRPLSPWQELARGAEPRGGSAKADPRESDIFAGSESSADAEPFRVFERVRAWMDRTARPRPPLLVVLEDLNWADAPSLLLLKFLGRDIKSIPVLIVATYRDAPLDPALARVLGAICREKPARRLELEGLDLPAASELAAQLVGSQVSPQLVEAVWRKADGNPLFLSQMFHVMAMDQIREPVAQLTSTLLAPETVREAIAAHLEPLSAPCREALAVAAVLGQTLRLDWLAETMGVAPLALMDPLDEACRARILSPLSSARDGFHFRHGVVRDVLYRRLNLVDKTRWHRAAGEALARLHDAGSVDDPIVAAEHLVRGAAGGDNAASLAWLTRTSSVKWTAGARDDAMTLLERAFELSAPPHSGAHQASPEVFEMLGVWSTAAPDDSRLKIILEKFQRRKQAAEARKSGPGGG